MGGGAPREVADHVVDADWAPDGSALAVIRVEGGKAGIEFPIGKTLYVAAALSNVRVSPGGDRVAFVEHPVAGDSRGGVAVVDLAGSKRALSFGWASLVSLAWSPDGREIWFSATRSGADLSVWAVTPEGHEREVYRGAGSVYIQDTLPDGRILVKAFQGARSLLGRAPGEAGDRDLSWLDWGWPADLSRDGKTLLFSEQGNGGGRDYATYVRGTDGAPPVLLGKGDAHALSPDGRFAVVLDIAEPAHLMLLPTGAGDPRPLPRGTLAQFHSATFFPDGRRIAITGNEEGKPPRVFVQQIAGGDPTPISEPGVTLSGNSQSNPLSGGGRTFASADETGLALYPVSGGESRHIRGSERGDVALRFSTDDRFLYARAFDMGQGIRVPARIVRINLASGTRESWRDLAPPGAPGYASIVGLVIAPEAEAYVYAYTLPVSTLYEVSGLR
jgi:dipeptidyl aminopeptidase/acylaminoacyl peptidase